MEETPLFSYDPLPDSSTHVRLLKLDPGGCEDPIVCTLTAFELQHAPSYDAISYTWGDPALTDIITVNRCPLDVRANCYYSLWQTRHYDSDRYYWIDAICSNQEDLTEKGHQVQLMGDIFTHASRVVVSLGHHANDSSTLFVDLHELSTLKENVPWEVAFKRDRLKREQEFLDLCQAAIALGNRQYWRRMWIVQELALAREIVLLCETDTLSWRILSNAMFYLHSYVNSLAFPGQQLHNWQTYHAILSGLTVTPLRQVSKFIYLRKFNMKLEFTVIWDYVKDQECEILLDRIYGLLNLLPNQLLASKEGRMIADYTKSTYDLAMDCVDHFRKIEVPSWRILPTVVCLLGYLRFDQQYCKLRNFIDERREYYLRRRQQDTSPTLSSAIHEAIERDSLNQRLKSKSAVHDENTGIYCSISQNASRNIYISLGEDGFLTANPAFEHWTLYRDGIVLGLTPYGRILFNKVAHLSDDLRPQPLMYQGDVAGLLCGRALPGDWLFEFGETESSTYLEVSVVNYLVVRHFHGEMFEIVGQALIHSRLSARWSTEGPIQPEGQFTLHFCKNDMIAFAAQDLLPRPGAPPLQLEGKVELHMKRLITSPSRSRFSSFVTGEKVPQSLRLPAKLRPMQFG